MNASNNNHGGHTSQRKVCNENKRKKQRKNDARVRFFNRRKEFTLVLQKTVVMHLDDNYS